MKNAKHLMAVLLMAAGLLMPLAGCHSGVMRGAGEDVSKLGNKMQQ